MLEWWKTTQRDVTENRTMPPVGPRHVRLYVPLSLSLSLFVINEEQGSIFCFLRELVPYGVSDMDLYF